MSRWIMGKNCIFEVLDRAPERLIEVRTPHKEGSLYEALRRRGIKITHTPKQALTKLVSSDSHQSYVARVSEREEINLKEFLATPPERSVVLMLDSIFDPHNFGAIMRSAECFGVDLVVYSKNRGSDITPTVTKTSAGATELVNTVKVSNLAETLAQFQRADYWAVAAEISNRTVPYSELEFPERTLLVLGSEGKGVQPLISKRCDHHVMIPMQGQIDSLNVSQAAAVLLSKITLLSCH